MDAPQSFIEHLSDEIDDDSADLAKAEELICELRARIAVQQELLTSIKKAQSSNQPARKDASTYWEE